MSKPLTERQEKVVSTIQFWIKEHGFPPTIRELRGPLGIKSLRGVTTHLDALAKKGVLMRKRGARRSPWSVPPSSSRWSVEDSAKRIGSSR